MISPFTLHRPSTLEEALSLLQRYGEEAKVLAGGSELILLCKMGFLRPAHLIDIKGISGLDRIELDPETRRVRVGGLVTHRALELSAVVRERLPVLAALERQVANVRIRNVGTLAGNLCFAEPHADPGALLMACDARVKASSVRGDRSLSISDFFVDDYQNALEQDEILTEIEIPELKDNFTGTYLRFCPAERPTVGVALLMAWSNGVCEDARLALGCLGPKPIRAAEVEGNLRQRSSEQILANAWELGAKAALLCDPSPDLWGSVEYKRQIVKTLVSRAVEQLCKRDAAYE
ncbi:MAG: xanthine dehydrogenase family protein subunit M [Deltaproteobacteria bacterium]|nr:xanthine dehydrogenase family protein subunit M [Deltaproteobacteria bacterium]